MWFKHHKCECKGECLTPKVVVDVEIPETKPSPNMITKPKDITQNCFGFSCDNKHCFLPFDSLQLGSLTERKVCPDCSGISKPCIIVKVSEPQWTNIRSIWSMVYETKKEPEWGWSNGDMGNIIWNRYEFVRFLDCKEVKNGKTIHKQ